jgi:hypothetical protein
VKVGAGVGRKSAIWATAALLEAKNGHFLNNKRMHLQIIYNLEVVLFHRMARQYTKLVPHVVSSQSFNKDTSITGEEKENLHSEPQCAHWCNSHQVLELHMSIQFILGENMLV